MFFIRGRITRNTVDDFKYFLRNKADLTEKKIYIRIFSDGGDVWLMTILIHFIYFLEKYKGCEVITQGFHIGSAALQLFANGTTREVTYKTTGYVHLPVARNSTGEFMRTKKWAADQIAAHSNKKLTSEKVFQLENIRLNGPDFFRYGLADKVVEHFA